MTSMRACLEQDAFSVQFVPERLVVYKPKIMHGIQDTPVHGLETISHVW